MICIQEWVEDYVKDRGFFENLLHLLQNGDTLQKCRDQKKHSLDLLEVALALSILDKEQLSMSAFH
jgi:hypothetical protein